jgi:hypothetical protein
MKIPAALFAIVGTTTFLSAANAAPPEEAFKRAQVWTPTTIATMDIRTGPTGPGAFPFQAEVTCNYLDEDLSGRSPKFACKTDKGDELKVKYGGTNGEVYAEVATSRLLWALGFGADHMYPVRVVCRGCPKKFNGVFRDSGDQVFDPATIERKMPAAEISDAWSWKDLDDAAGAPPAHRDGLKLLAVLLQHTDSKPQQQRLVCLDVEKDEKFAKDATCTKPLLIMQDVGVTFGRANTFNKNPTGSMNLEEWSETPVWKPETTQCIGNLPKSFTGTLDDPVISEEGRRFLSGLLEQLTDRQLQTLFEVARVTHRLRDPGDAKSGFPVVDEWVAAFKQKRAEIANRRCA